MKTIIDEKGIVNNIYTDDEIAFVKLVWIVQRLAMPYLTFFYPHYVYSVEFGKFLHQL